MLKNDKMKLGRVRFERYKKFLKCFDKDAKELQAQKELLSQKRWANNESTRKDCISS